MIRQVLAVSLLGIASTSGPLWASAAAHSQNDWSFGRPGLATDVARTVQIDADEYTFTPAQLSVKAGETIKFVVTNRGRLKHELTIGDAAEQQAHQQSMSRMADMKHDEGSHDMPANSVHVAPGQTQVLIWKFSKSGALIVACNYPGHSELGMRGELQVR